MSLLRLLLFVPLLIAVQVLVHYYLWRKLIKNTNIVHPLGTWATRLIIVMAALVPLTMLGARLVDPRVGQILGWPVFIWFALVFLVVVGLLIVDLSHLVVRGGARIKRGPTWIGPGSVDMDRRQFMARLAGGTVVSAAAGTVGLGMHEVLGSHEIVEVPVRLSRLPMALDGFSIVQITDLHAGYTVGRSFVQGVVDRANQARPDVIVLTGDIVDGSVAALADAVAPLAELAAPHGVFLVTGNHEYYVGVESWLDEFKRLGIRVLRNQRVSIGRGRDSFDLAGIDDFHAAQYGNGHGPDLERALAGRDPGRELVLLAHQPRQVRDTRGHGVGLQLSGHTHGGQIWPWHYLARAQQGGLLAGLSRHNDTQLYVSRGAGYWGPPVRLGAPSEITKIILRPSRSA